MKERQWLNLGSGHAFIETDEDSISIADCNRTVSLDFGMDEDYKTHLVEVDELDNIEYKIDTLYDVIKRYRAYIKKDIRKARKKHEAS